jgi:tetratricopeptide (TPR) repeat protein
MIVAARLTKIRHYAAIRRWKDVIELASDGLAIDAQHCDLLDWLGQAYYELGHNEDALQTFEKACAVDPDSSRLHQMRSLALSRLERFPESLDAAEISLNVDPNDPRSHIRVSRAARLAGNPQRAWSAAHRARELDPWLGASWANLAWNAEKEYLWPKAAEYYSEQLRLEPVDPRAHHELATVNKRLGNRDDARRGFQQAIQCDPKRSSSYQSLAQIQFEDGLENEAFATLRGLIETDPSDIDGRTTLIEKLLQYDFVDQANQVAADGVQTNPTSVLAWCYRAQCCKRTGDLNAMLAHCQHALELSPQSPYALRMVSWALTLHKRWAESIATAEQALANKPGDLANWSQLIECLSRAGKHDDALSRLREIMAKTPECGWLWGDLADALAAGGDFDGASDAAQELVRREPKILRYRNWAARFAWLANNTQRLVESKAEIAALPPEQTRFGKRLLFEATLQCDLYLAILREDWSLAEQTLEVGLRDASRGDEDTFACSLVCALGVVQSRSTRVIPTEILAGASFGPHHSKRCNSDVCADLAHLAQYWVTSRTSLA